MKRKTKKPSVLKLVTTEVVGVEHRLKTRSDRLKLYRQLQVGLVLEVRREPKNLADGNACAVYVGAQHIGYIPRRFAARLAPRLDSGAKMVFFVHQYNAHISGHADTTQISLLGFELSEISGL